MTCFFKRFSFVFFAIAALLVQLAVSFAVLDGAMMEEVSQEGRWIENMSVIFLFQAVALGIYAARKSGDKGWYLYSYLALAAAWRELGGHKAFTSDSILKSRFYVTPEFPLWEKLLGAAFILSLLYCIVQLLRKFIPSLKALWQGVVHVQAIYACLGLYTVAKVLDGFFRRFPSLSHLRDDYGSMMLYAEESMEMFGAFFLMYAAFYYVLHRYEQHASAQ